MWRFAFIITWSIAASLVGIQLAKSQANHFWSNPRILSCCSEADAVYADDWSIMPDGSAVARVTGGGPRNHAWAPIGREYTIPKERVVDVPGNPTGRPMLFLHPSALTLYCFALGPMI